MITYNQLSLEKYLSTDLLMPILHESEFSKEFIGRRWLEQSEAKRMLFWDVYKDILTQRHPELQVLDVGGGICVPEPMVTNYHYQVLDILVHEDHQKVGELETKLKKKFWINSSWEDYNITGKKWDIVVANDLFPNVDQRLEQFIEKYMPHTKEIRLLLTFYNKPTFYRVKRVDADEMLTVLAWTGKQTLSILEKFQTLVEGYNPKVLIEPTASLFRNGRQICKVSLFNRAP